MQRTWLGLAVLVGFTLANDGLAQTSSSFKLEEHTFNAGGHPEGGVIPTSSSFKITLDAIDDGLAGTSLNSSSFLMNSGFTASFPPPTEVQNLNFITSTTMVWDADGSIGDYALYRDTVDNISPGFGACVLPTPASETATDLTVPGLGQVQFYIVTARNRLLEEGTKGFTSLGPERGNAAPCP